MRKCKYCGIEIFAGKMCDRCNEINGKILSKDISIIVRILIDRGVLRKRGYDIVLNILEKELLDAFEEES